MPGRKGRISFSRWIAVSISVRIGLVLLGPALLLPAGSPPAPAQATGKTPQHDVSVTLKLIQVYVTDKDGKPVRDLTKEDFALFDNGRPVALTAFEKHDLAAVPAAEGAPAPEPVAKPAAAPALNRKIILLFDFAFNTAHGIVAGVQAARHFLDTRARPGDELALISISALKGVRIREFLTADHAKIRGALAAVTAKDIAGRADEIEQAYWMLTDTSGVSKALSREEGIQSKSMDMQRRDSMQQAGKYFGDLTRLAQALRLVQGQKTVLFFSTGVPSSLINMSRSVGTDKNISPTGSASWKSTGTVWQVGDPVLGSLQKEMLQEFSASNCSFYAFDTRESSKPSALFAYDELAFLNRPSGGLLGADTGGVFRDDKTTGMESLRRLSKDTGGKYYSNIALHEKNLQEVSEATGAYYVLGYPIAATADGRFHELKVEVARQGCRVRTQPGYFDPKPFTAYTDIEKNIHLFDLALNERSEFQAPKALPITALAYDGGQGARVRALARIPGDIWTQFGGQAMELVALFFDGQDSLLSLQRLALGRTDYGGKELAFSAGAAARPGATRCRFVLRDLDTGQSAIASTTVYAGPTNRQSLSVFSPLLVVRGGALFLLEGVVKGAAESPGWREIYPFDAAAFSPVFGGEPVRSAEVGVIVPYSAPGLGAADLTFRANLVTSTGQNVPLPLELGAPGPGGTVEAQPLTLSLAGVPNGAYTLYVHVGNKITGQVSSVRAPLTVSR